MMHCLSWSVHSLTCGGESHKPPPPQNLSSPPLTVWPSHPPLVWMDLAVLIRNVLHQPEQGVRLPGSWRREGNGSPLPSSSYPALSSPRRSTPPFCGDLEWQPYSGDSLVCWPLESGCPDLFPSGISDPARPSLLITLSLNHRQGCKQRDL